MCLRLRSSTKATLPTLFVTSPVSLLQQFSGNSKGQKYKLKRMVRISLFSQ